MPLRQGLVDAGITVPSNNAQIIDTLNYAYDNSPTFRYAVQNLSRPLAIGFGGALGN